MPGSVVATSSVRPLFGSVEPRRELRPGALPIQHPVVVVAFARS